MSFPAEQLLAAARAAREHAHAPFSKFAVGAALEARNASGVATIYSGCNIENASYGLTICAERVAIFKAISEGAAGFAQIAVVTASPRLTPPCGACRQIIWEFCGPIPVLLGDLEGHSATHSSQALLPYGFDDSFL